MTGPGTTSAESDRQLAQLTHGLDPPIDQPKKSFDTVSLSAELDRTSPVPSRFRLGMSRIEDVAKAVGATEKGDADAEGVLDEFDRDVNDSIFWEMNQLSSDVDFVEAKARLHAARRAWVITKDAQDQVAWDGVLGYFGNRGNETIAAVAGFRFLGMPAHADALDRAISQLPRDDDGQVAWQTYPLPPDKSAAVEVDFDAICAGGAIDRARYALQNPHLFFTAADDAFLPQPAPEDSESPAPNDK